MKISGKTVFFIGATLFLALCALVFIPFLEFHEARVDAGGILFSDPVFQFLPVADCSVSIFSITYGSLVLFLLTDLRKFERIPKFMASYGLLLLFRMITLSILPLKEPDTLVYLQDPFLNNLIYPGNIDADLFFSGHTGTVFLLYFLTRKWWYALLGILLGILLMIQRVHYSIDIIAAIPIALITVKLVDLFLVKFVRKD